MSKEIGVPIVCFAMILGAVNGMIIRSKSLYYIATLLAVIGINISVV